MNKNNEKTEKTPKLKSLTSVADNQGMVCGPEGCSLADHYGWAKDKKKDKKQKH